MARLPEDLAVQVRRALKSPGADQVHDLRVAIRRYNQALAVNSQDRNKSSRRLLKQTLECAGEVRNFDIALKLIGKIKGTKALAASLRTRRRAAAKSLVAHLKGDFEDWANEAPAPPRRKSASMLPVIEAARRLFKYGRKSRQASQLHRLRIAAKKLRYTLELVEPNHPRLDQIKRLQSELGNINDYRTTRAILKVESHGSPVRDELKRKQKLKIRDFRRHWAGFFGDPGTESSWVRGFSKPREVSRAAATRDSAQRVA
jgi:CHAD domain-containing protein